MAPFVKDVGLTALVWNRDRLLLERWLRSPHVVQWWGTSGTHLDVLAERPSDTQAVINADGRSVGYICWQSLLQDELETLELTDLPEDLVDIDILIGEEEYLGLGVGPKALSLLLSRLRFKGVGYAGVGTSNSNHAAIRAFEKAGFRFFKAFEEPEFGACLYMVAKLDEAVEQPVAADIFDLCSAAETQS